MVLYHRLALIHLELQEILLVLMVLKLRLVLEDL
jgi:hypothetical protein